MLTRDLQGSKNLSTTSSEACETIGAMRSSIFKTALKNAKLRSSHRTWVRNPHYSPPLSPRPFDRWLIFEQTKRRPLYWNSYTSKCSDTICLGRRFMFLKLCLLPSTYRKGLAIWRQHKVFEQIQKYWCWQQISWRRSVEYITSPPFLHHLTSV